jgi:hypothetical protein
MALTLAAAAIGATPASAQSLGPDFNIGGSAEQPDSGGPAQPNAKSFGTQRDYNSRGFQLGCMSNREIRRGLRDYGFSDIEFTRILGRSRVKVQALFEDDWYYSMWINRCSGHVDRVVPLYPADTNDNGDTYDNGGYGGHGNGNGSSGYGT